MFRVQNRLLMFLLLAFFLKEIIFAIFVPIFQTPDEQAHFAQVAYFSEFNKMPSHITNFDLNSEILKTEQYLGTARDEHGNNQYTYHPEYKLEFTNTTLGKYEVQIRNILVSDRTKLVKQEAARYPQTYYLIASVGYKLFYYNSIIERIYIDRFISIVMSLGTVFIAWLIGKELFEKNNFLAVSLTALVAFQPMFSYVSAGVNSDNLMNLLFSALIYGGILLINRGLSVKRMLFSLAILILLFFTKPQFILGIPILLLAILLRIIFYPNSKIIQLVALFIILVSVVFAYLLMTNINFLFAIQQFYPQLFFPGFAKINFNPLKFLWQSLQKTVAETVPWYWGVFDWLGVTMPRVVYQIINRLSVLAVIGIGVKLFVIVRKKEKKGLIFIYLLLVSSIYYLGIVYFNYLFYLSNQYSFGIQGRYFFPTIIAQMALLMLGLNQLIPDKLFRLKLWLNKVLVLSMILLNFIALGTIIHIYYNLSGMNIFLTQVSQYKIGIFKGNLLFFWIGLYFLITIVFITKMMQLKNIKAKN